MNESVMIGLAATGCVLGFCLNRTYVKKYGEAAIQWPALILQCICVAGALSQLPGGVVSFWFVFWLLAVAVSYAGGLWLCRQHAQMQQAGQGDVVRAMTAQAVLPFGLALAFLMAAGMILFGFIWVH